MESMYLFQFNTTAQTHLNNTLTSS